MLNNFFHDFAVALLFASLLVLGLIYRASKKENFKVRIDFARELYQMLNRVIVGCWVVIILGGIVRTLAYEQYEWTEAAGRGQVIALILKHLLLVSFVVGGTVLQLRLRKLFKAQQ